MTTFLTDSAAAELLAERKELPPDWRQLLETKLKRGHQERDLDLTGVAGNHFRVILRESSFNQLDFSAILGWLSDDTTRLLRLRRYNGKSHRHTNALERHTFEGFHIHKITERYQQSGFREDSYAEPTDRYSTLQEALACLIVDCGLVVPPNDQLDLLEAGAV